jgi:hypothetical protein
MSLLPTVADKPMKKCDGCGEECAKLKLCSACLSVSYCSAACQNTAWAGHKTACKAEKIRLRIKKGSGAEPDMGSRLVALKRFTEGDLYNACLLGKHEELQKVLRQAGLDVSWAHPNHGDTAVHTAAENGHDKCLSAVIQYGGADLAKLNTNGFAPIHKACTNGRIACLIILLDHGVDANTPCLVNDVGFTPAILCCIAGHVKCLALLIDRGADVNLADGDGNTPTLYTCLNGQSKCLQLLISRGAGVNAKDIHGRTPLDFARQLSCPECIELLLEKNALGKRVEDIHTLSEAQKVRCVFLESASLPTIVMSFHDALLLFYTGSAGHKQKSK